MAVHTVFAQISSGIVRNIVVGDYYDCDIAAKSTYGIEAFAIEVTQIPTQIDDLYEDGKFYRMVNGKKKWIEPIPTDSQKIDSLMQSNGSTSELLEEVATLLLELAEASE